MGENAQNCWFQPLGLKPRLQIVELTVKRAKIFSKSRKYFVCVRNQNRIWCGDRDAIRCVKYSTYQALVNYTNQTSNFRQGRNQDYSRLEFILLKLHCDDTSNCVWMRSWAWLVGQLTGCHNRNLRNRRYSSIMSRHNENSFCVAINRKNLFPVTTRLCRRSQTWCIGNLLWCESYGKWNYKMPNAINSKCSERQWCSWLRHETRRWSWAIAETVDGLCECVFAFLCLLVVGVYLGHWLFPHFAPGRQTKRISRTAT